MQQLGNPEEAWRAGDRPPNICCPLCGGDLELDIDFLIQSATIDCLQCSVSWDRWGKEPEPWPGR